MRPLIVVVVCLLAWSPILWNGAGFSYSDDVYSLRTSRPLLRLTYEMNERAGGWMATNLAIHAAGAVVLLYLSGSLAAAGLFAAHPMTGDAVASVAGRSSLLCGALMMGSLLALKGARLWASAALGLLALLAKEEAVALLALVPMALFFWGRRREAVFSFVACAVTAACLLLMWRPDGAGAPRVNLAAASAIGSHVTANLVWPVGLTAEPDTRGSRAWPLTALYPSMWPYVFADVADPILEHRAYAAVAGGMWMMSNLLPGHSWTMIAMAFAVVSWSRCRAYASPLNLYADAVVQSPRLYRPRVNYGNFLALAGMRHEAERQYAIAIGLEPTRPQARNNLAALRVQRGDMRGATEALDGIF